MKNILLSAAIALSSSCASLQSISVTDIPKQRSNMVTADASKFVFLGLTFDNDFINRLSDDLSRQCRGGKVSGIMTKHETYFYFIAHTVKVRAQGYCVKGKTKA